MKPISVEKCLDVIPNKFYLSLLAMNRAKKLMLGAKSSDEYQSIEKNSYIALKEIENGQVDLVQLKTSLINDLNSDNLFKKNIEMQSNTAHLSNDFNAKEIIEEEILEEELADDLNDEFEITDEEDDFSYINLPVEGEELEEEEEEE